MALTPADIHNTEFTKASLGRRGYDENDVDTLLDEATGEMIRLLEENDALRTRLDAGEVDDPAGRRRAAQAELSAAIAALDRARRACDRAEWGARQVRQQLDDALRTAAATAGGDDASPERVLVMAQHTADEYVREAEDKARALLTEARDRADRTLREARELVAAIDRESHEHQNEAMADLAAGRAGLVRDIDELTGFAADYHSALEHHLHRQGQLIDGTGGR